MESKNITRESSINFNDEDYQEYRKREGLRAFIEEYNSFRAERKMSQTVINSHYRVTRQDLPDPRWKNILRRNKNHREETNQDTIVDA